MDGQPQGQTFQQFLQAVEELVNGTAAAKGYSQNGPNGPNPLYEFIEQIVGGPHHALGEIVYKAVRYEAKRNPDDLVKIAAWAWLAWKHHRD